MLKTQRRRIRQSLILGPLVLAMASPAYAATTVKASPASASSAAQAHPASGGRPASEAPATKPEMPDASGGLSAQRVHRPERSLGP